jgi:hypothetical protein
VFWEAKHYEGTYSHLFGCKSDLPFSLLGSSMIYRKLSNKVQKHVEERIEKDLVDGKENIYRLEVDY